MFRGFKRTLGPDGTAVTRFTPVTPYDTLDAGWHEGKTIRHYYTLYDDSHFWKWKEVLFNKVVAEAHIM